MLEIEKTILDTLVVIDIQGRFGIEQSEKDDRVIRYLRNLKLGNMQIVSV